LIDWCDRPLPCVEFFYAGLAGHSTTTGKEAFDQWYQDTARVNLPKSHTIVLSDARTPGLFEFSDGAFFPAD